MTKAAVSDSVEVKVRAIASGGAGVADLPDGRIVFVPRTAPGDHARITIEKSRSSWALASLDELLDEGEGRVEAPCPLYDRCGGCQLQHLPYEVQLEWKGRAVVDALERIGKLETVPVPEVVPSPRPWHYRTRMTFTLRRLRSGRVVAGLHALEHPAHVLDIDGECLLPRQEVLDAWTSLRDAWESGARRLPDGGRLRLTLRSVADGVELIVEGGEPGWRPGGLIDDVEALIAIWHAPSGSERPALVAGGAAPGLGDAFEQVNPEAADLLREHVLDVAVRLLGRRRLGEAGAGAGPGEAVGSEGAGPDQAAGSEGADPDDVAGARDSHALRVVDAYCGTGRVGRALAADGLRVTGIELNALAVAAARERAPEGFEVVEGSVEARLGEHLPCDLLLLNPPRSGLDPSIPDLVRGAPPEHVVYVSCDPATLGRDLGALGPAYELTDLRCFDLFPQTAHVETVAVLRWTGDVADA